jgi:hypothetical protein
VFEHLQDYICVALCDGDCSSGALAILAAFLLRSPLKETVIAEPRFAATLRLLFPATATATATDDDAAAAAVQEEEQVCRARVLDFLRMAHYSSESAAAAVVQVLQQYVEQFLLQQQQQQQQHEGASAPGEALLALLNELMTA